MVAHLLPPPWWQRSSGALSCPGRWVQSRTGGAGLGPSGRRGAGTKLGTAPATCWDPADLRWSRAPGQGTEPPASPRGSAFCSSSTGADFKRPQTPVLRILPGRQRGTEAVKAECLSALRIPVSRTTAPDETQSCKIPLNICERLPGCLRWVPPAGAAPAQPGQRHPAPQNHGAGGPGATRQGKIWGTKTLCQHWPWGAGGGAAALP